MTTHAIERAAQYVGGQSALARKLGCSPQAVSRMCSTGKVPAERVIQIEAATGGAVSRHELRPDLYPVGDSSREFEAVPEPKEESTRDDVQVPDGLVKQVVA